MGSSITNCSVYASQVHQPTAPRPPRPRRPTIVARHGQDAPPVVPHAVMNLQRHAPFCHLLQALNEAAAGEVASDGTAA